MSFALSQQARDRIEGLASRYPEKSAALLPVLHVIQREHGRVSPAAVEWVAATLGVPTLRVREVLSFYSLLRRESAGRYVIQVCRNISCSLAGAEDVLGHLENRLGVKAGGTTPDGKFTLLAVECLGNCDRAPCLMVNDDDHGPVTPDLADSLLEELR
ncbi:MAG TPA: NADH-quinone oxidoreductase subunit NuoE [Terriglobales bacterium]|nr:NADH-quinone oxidoreductase subunit NuoE [Terriglobales bacterium]